jgi:hypothetical protein
MAAMAGAFSAEEFDELLYRVGVKFGEMEQQARILTDRVTGAVRWMGPMGDGVVRLLETMWELIKKIWNEIKNFFTQPGVPWTLWSHGGTWAGPSIAGRISELTELSTLNRVRSDDYWQGPAADAYRNTLGPQKDALAALVQTAQTIDDTLARTAIAIGAFWLAILTAVTSAIMEFTAESAAASTGVGAPPAAAAGGMSAAKLVALISATVTALYIFAISTILPEI